MSGNNISIGIDPRSLKRLNDQIETLKKEAGRSFYSAMVKAAFKIKAEAQLRLTGRGHIITSRLKNSIFVKGFQPIITPNNQLTYSDTEGKTYKSDLSTVKLKETDLAVGTNVEYADIIEFGGRPHWIRAKNAKVLSNGKQMFGTKAWHPGFGGDSFLYWAYKNVDIFSSVGKDMQNDLKFGKFLKQVNTKSEPAMTGGNRVHTNGSDINQ